MMTARHKLLIANWKLHPESLREAKELVAPIKSAVKKLSKVEVVICPPALFLPALAGLGPVPRLTFGAQDAFWEATGAYTGQISARLVRKAGARYVILGHSECRALGDTDESINRRVKAAFKEDLKVVLCVGEQVRDQHGFYLKTLRQQLEDGLRGIPRSRLSGLIVAYEPLWAIGDHAVAADTPVDFVQQAIFIRKVVSNLVGNGQAKQLPVLYGGSVTPKNAVDFFSLGQADGLLVGRESLQAEHFINILRLANDAPLD